VKATNKIDVCICRWSRWTN